jgi:formylglycine-generating enzyme required for sulfatase activity
LTSFNQGVSNYTRGWPTLPGVQRDVPKGCFQMGCVSGIGCADDEEPVHRVCLDGFWLGKYEVTQAQWEKIMGSNPSNFPGDSHPVEKVSWHDVQQFLQRLNGNAGKTMYRLPTEAEWEYAARAGTTTSRFWGDDPDDACQYANVHDQTSKQVNTFEWEVHHCDDGYAVTAPVGSFHPNAFGLYDMSGNVWEWCQDWYSSEYYAKSSGENSQGPSSGKSRVLRGGSWYDNPHSCRSASRNWGHPGNRYYSRGFRVVSSVDAWTQ